MVVVVVVIDAYAVPAEEARALRPGLRIRGMTMMRRGVSGRGSLGSCGVKENFISPFPSTETIEPFLCAVWGGKI